MKCYKCGRNVVMNPTSEGYKMWDVEKDEYHTHEPSPYNKDDDNKRDPIDSNTSRENEAGY